jgi:hypothetical protein
MWARTGRGADSSRIYGVLYCSSVLSIVDANIYFGRGQVTNRDRRWDPAMEPNKQTAAGTWWRGDFLIAPRRQARPGLVGPGICGADGF